MKSLPMDEMQNNPVHVGEILSSLEGLRARLSEYRIHRIWKEVVGDKVAERSHPLRLKDKTLYVRVVSSPWMQELSLFKDRIIKGLNERLGEKTVEEMVFKLGRIPRQSRPQEWRPPDNLSEGAKKRIGEILSPIKDEGLREVLFRLLVKDAALKLHRLQKE